jgi:hypothetical protein
MTKLRGNKECLSSYAMFHTPLPLDLPSSCSGVDGVDLDTPPYGYKSTYISARFPFLFRPSRLIVTVSNPRSTPPAGLVPVASVLFFVDFASCRARGRLSHFFAFRANDQVNDHSFIVTFETNAAPAYSGNSYIFFHPCQWKGTCEYKRTWNFLVNFASSFTTREQWAPGDKNLGFILEAACSVTESSIPFSTPKTHSLTFEPSAIIICYLIESTSTFTTISSTKPPFLDLFVWHGDRLQLKPSVRTTSETPKTQILRRMAFTKLSLKAIATTLLLCIASVDAHMIMLTPTPYGKSTLDNSPLDATGADFPCKQRSGVYDAEGASNTMVIGEPQTLSFLGSAVHGGGSCQVSLTTDLQPTASSQFMVIHSIQGNCPSNVTGNLDADASGTGAAVFQYTIPAGIAPGQYTIAWSWVNKVGNREFYMNCGPATVVAAKKKRYAPAPSVSKRQSSFPAMFVANLQSVNDCITIEGDDTLYPDPGSSVQNGAINTNLQPAPACAAAAGGAAGTPSSGPAPAATSSGVGGSSPSASSAPGLGSAPSSAGSPGVFATGASSAAPVATSTAVVSPIPASQAPAAASSAASAGAPAPSGTTPTAGAQSGPCTDEGEWFCSADGSSFQRCASGVWSTSMAMAAGTTCTPGLSDSLTMTAAKSKRFNNHVRRAHRLSDALNV